MCGAMMNVAINLSQVPRLSVESAAEAAGADRGIIVDRRIGSSVESSTTYAVSVVTCNESRRLEQRSHQLPAPDGVQLRGKPGPCPRVVRQHQGCRMEDAATGHARVAN